MSQPINIKSASLPSSEDVSNQLSSMKDEVTRLASSVASVLDRQTQSVLAQAGDMAEIAKKNAMERVDLLAEEVAKNPLRSLGFAFGAGLILALLARGK